MKFLEHRIPPPAVALCLAILMWFAPSVVPSLAVPFDIRLGLALALLVVGQAIAIAGMVSFRRAKTTVNPLKPDNGGAGDGLALRRGLRRLQGEGARMDLTAFST